MLSISLSPPPPPQPTYRLEEILPQYILAWALFFAFTLLFHFTKRWSIAAISSVSAVQIVLISVCFLLGGYTTRTPSTTSPAASVNATVASGAGTGAPQSLLSSTDDLFRDEMPAPFIAGLTLISLAGAGAFPMFPRYAFILYATPVAWLVANLAWEQPQGVFLRVSLLHMLLLIQVSWAAWGVATTTAGGPAFPHYAFPHP